YVFSMRKSASVLMPETARRYTLPPLPPSPPSGPPRGMNFSRRKLVLPRPPFPACTFTCASSTNFMAESLHRKAKPRRTPGFHVRLPERESSVGFGDRRLEFRDHVYVEVLLRAALLELHLAVDLGEQGVIRSGPDVRPGANRRTALANQDVA